MAIVFANSCSQSDVQAAHNASSENGIVIIPPGTATWGTGDSYLTFTKKLKFIGAGVASTIITIATNSRTYFNGTVICTAPCWFTGLRFNQLGGNDNSVFTFNAGSDGWRVSGCLYDDGFTGVNGVDPWNVGYEYLFCRYSGNSWTTASTYGSANMVVMEGNTVNGAGYTDFNGGARGCVRFNTFTGPQKVDSHGYASNNNPHESCRHLEVYHNTWTNGGGNYSSLEARGGGLIAFNNTAVNSITGWTMRDYGVTTSSSNFGGYQTPNNYPLHGQIGTGQMVSIPVTSLTNYRHCVINDPGDTVWASIGAGGSTAGTRFTATGPGTGTGTVWITPAATEPAYVFSNLRNGVAWPINVTDPVAGAETLYNSQSGIPSFDGTDIIQSNRDFFASTGLAANTGVTVGDFASMGSAPVTNKFGYWVTDRGSWRDGYANTSGELWVSNGTSYSLAYTPLVYPYPYVDTFISSIPRTYASVRQSRGGRARS
jgi:hypothetical protein